MAKRCKICKFWSTQGKYRIGEKATFEKKCREGSSLRDMVKYLEFCGLKVSRETVRRHLQCMDIDVRLQRKAEIEIKKEQKGIRGKLRGIFRRPHVGVKLECEHKFTENFFDINEEVVRTKCSTCGKILSGSIDPNLAEKKREKNDRANWVLWEALNT